MKDIQLTMLQIMAEGDTLSRRLAFDRRVRWFSFNRR